MDAPVEPDRAALVAQAIHVVGSTTIANYQPPHIIPMGRLTDDDLHVDSVVIGYWSEGRIVVQSRHRHVDDDRVTQVMLFEDVTRSENSDRGWSPRRYPRTNAIPNRYELSALDLDALCVTLEVAKAADST
jgi:hypothetical protein